MKRGRLICCGNASEGRLCGVSNDTEKHSVLSRSRKCASVKPLNTEQVKKEFYVFEAEINQSSSSSSNTDGIHSASTLQPPRLSLCHWVCLVLTKKSFWQMKVQQQSRQMLWEKETGSQSRNVDFTFQQSQTQQLFVCLIDGWIHFVRPAAGHRLFNPTPFGWMCCCQITHEHTFLLFSILVLWYYFLFTFIESAGNDRCIFFGGYWRLVSFCSLSCGKCSLKWETVHNSPSVLMQKLIMVKWIVYILTNFIKIEIK